jgi:hypothetical protein
VESRSRSSILAAASITRCGFPEVSGIAAAIEERAVHAISRRARTALLLPLLLAGLLPGAARAGTFHDLLVSSFSWGPTQPPPAFALGKDAAGRLLLQDRSATGSVRLTRLGASVAPGTPRGNVMVGPDGVGWLVLSSREAGIELYRLGDVSVPGPLQAVRVDSYAAGPQFDPDSVRLGIIAILIGLYREPVPTISLVDGTSNTLLLWNGFHLLPFLEQQG